MAKEFRKKNSRESKKKVLEFIVNLRELKVNIIVLFYLYYFIIEIKRFNIIKKSFFTTKYNDIKYH